MLKGRLNQPAFLFMTVDFPTFTVTVTGFPALFWLRSGLT